MIDELAARCFAARDAAHREHWRTKNYAAHMALGDFYESLPDLVDSLVECYQGTYGELDSFDVVAKDGGEIVAQLREDLDWIQATRDDCCMDDEALLNLHDGIVNLYQKTLYLLTRFA